MDLIPYPPDWSRNESREIVDYWSRWERRTSIRSYLFLMGDDDEQSWRLFAATGSVALFLVMLLFLSAPRLTPQPVVQNREIQTFIRPVEPEIETPKEPEFIPHVDTSIETVARVVDTSYRVELTPALFEAPVVRTPPERQPEPEPFQDPFAMFAQPQKEEPKPVTVPQPPRPFVAPLYLAIDAETTDLVPDSLYTESIVSVEANSQIEYSAHPDRFFVEWRPATPRTEWDQFATTNTRWSDTALRRDAEELTSLHSAESISGEKQIANRQAPQVTLKKRYPAAASGGDRMSVLIDVTNHSTQLASEVLVFEEFEKLELVEAVRPQANLVDNQICWKLENLQPGETRTVEFDCRIPEQGMVSSESSIQISIPLAKRTMVEVPDVTVFVTVPTKVAEKDQFEALVLVRNDSQKEFGPSDLRINFPDGIRHQNEQALTKRIEVPKPGKSLEIPLTLQTTQAGEMEIEADLLLEDAIVVPVRAYLVVYTGETREGEKKKSIAKRLPDDFAAAETPFSTYSALTPNETVIE